MLSLWIDNFVHVYSCTACKQTSNNGMLLITGKYLIDIFVSSRIPTPAHPSLNRNPWRRKAKTSSRSKFKCIEFVNIYTPTEPASVLITPL